MLLHRSVHMAGITASLTFQLEWKDLNVDLELRTQRLPHLV